MSPQLWVPTPQPSIWDKFKCYIGIHDFESPTKESWVEVCVCKNRCPSHIIWVNGTPIKGVYSLFGKSRNFDVEITYEEKK